VPAHTWTEIRLNPNSEFPGIQGCQEKALVKSFEKSPHLKCMYRLASSDPFRASLWVRCGFRPDLKGYASKQTYQVGARFKVLTEDVFIPWSPEVFNSPCQILTLLNKVPGYWLQGKTDLANKPRTMQIFPHSKFGINRTSASKVMAKKYNFGQRNFLAITFKPAVRSIPNFEWGKIGMFLGLFAKSVSPWSQ